MSKTYKHQIKYELKNWEDPTSQIVVKKIQKYYYWRPVENGLPEYIEENVYREIPGKQNVNDPHWKYPEMSLMWIDVKRKKWYKKQSHQLRRRKVKNFLYYGQYEDAKHEKSRDIAWDIY